MKKIIVSLLALLLLNVPFSHANTVLPASQISVTTSAFTSCLNSSDTNVQLALNTIATCIGAGGGMTWPSGPGIVTFVSGTAWGTPIANGAGYLYNNGSGGYSYSTPGGAISGLTTNGVVFALSATSISSTAALTNGQILMGYTGNAPVAATITGTANNLYVSNGSGYIVLSTPITVATGKTLLVNNILTFAGTDYTTMTFPSSSTTVAGLGIAQTWTGVNKFTNGDLALLGTSTGYTLLESGLTSTSNNTLTLPQTPSDTLAGLGTAQTWTVAQTFTNSDIRLLGSSTGYTTFTSGNTGASNYAITFPAATDTIALIATAQALTNKTITSSTDVLGGVTMTLGSDASYDMYYRGTGGALTRLGIGTANQVLAVNSTATGYVFATGGGGSMTWPAGGAGIPNYTGSSAWGTSYTTSGSGTVLALVTSPTFVTPTLGVASATSLVTTGTAAGLMKLFEPSGTGSTYVAFQAPSSITSSVTWTLPAADGSGCFQSNGSGTVTIASCGAGSMTWPAAAGIAVYAGSSTWGTSIANGTGYLSNNGSGTYAYSGSLAKADPQLIGTNTSGVLVNTFLGQSNDDTDASGYASTGRFEMSLGTTGSPVVTAGNLLKISKTDNVPTSQCGGYSYNSECNSAFYVASLATSSNQMQNVAGTFYAESSTTAGNGADAVSVYGTAFVTGSANVRATAAYLSAGRGTSTGSVNGVEIRATNATASNCTYSTTTTNAGGCDGAIIDLGDNGSNSTLLSSALHIITTPGTLSYYHAGLTINTGTIDGTGYGIDDESGQSEKFVGLAAPPSHSYHVCVNQYGVLTSQSANCSG
jgi:hypothetical protein